MCSARLKFKVLSFPSLQGSYLVIHHPMSQQMHFSNLGGVPALFIIIFNVVLVMLGTVKIGTLR